MEGSGAQAPLLTYPQIQNLLRIEFARARRYSYPLCCLVAQVDGLDRLREVHGSKLRDEVLGRVIRAIQAQTRTSDTVGLYQDRIALILPHTDPAGARTVAERVRAAAGGQDFRMGTTDLRVTVSIGGSAFHERSTIFFDSILKSAEAALAQAIASGGDRIEMAAAAHGPPKA